MRRVVLIALLVAGCSADTVDTTSPSTTVVTSKSTTTTSTSTSTTSTTIASTTLPPELTFEGSIEDVDEGRLAHSWTTDCPVAPDDVVVVRVTHWGFDETVHEGEIVVARAEGENVLAIFRELFEIGYPIQSVIPIGDLPEGIEDDDPRYNNTSGLHCRLATGSSRWSEHASGLAIDINPFLNPFITSNTVWPADSGRYVDRSLDEPGMIHEDDPVVETFLDRGWHWGGYWESIKDYHHFSINNR